MSDSEHTVQVDTLTAPDDRESDYPSSDDESSSVEKSEWAKSRKQSYRSVVSGVVSVNPSPRVSTFDRPNRLLLINRGPEIDEDDKTLLKKKRLLKMIMFTCFVICLLSLIGVIIYLAIQLQNSPYCHFDDSDYVVSRDFYNPDVLDDLTPREYYAVKNFILGNKTMGVTNFNSASVNSSYILMIDLLLPNKNDTIHYLDSGDAMPSRDAIVTIVRGNVIPPVVEEYIVSPANSPFKVVPFKNPSYRLARIPYESRPLDAIDFRYIIPFVVNNLTEKLYPLLVESFGIHYHNCTTGVDCLRIVDRAPYERKNGSRKTWFWLFPDVEEFYLQPLGLNILVDHSSTNVSEWKVRQIIYNNLRFNSVSDLMKAFNEKSLEIIHCHSCRKSSRYSSNERLESMAGKRLPGPKIYEPEGKRFKIIGQNVRYNKWNFRYGMRPTTGLQILDIRFNGSRIAYEISLQEALVLYANHGKQQTMSSIYHTPHLLGGASMELVKGIDCPNTAVYLNSFMLANSENVKTYKKNICVFENYAAKPTTRHFANNLHYGYDFYSGTSDYHLIIRSIASVWNSDFIVDYIFYNNGAFEARVSKTGFMRTTFLPEEYSNTERQIAQHVYGDMHVDLFNYKVDLDVSGVRNKYTTVTVNLDSASDIYRNPRMSLDTKIMTNESKTVPYNGDNFQYHLITGVSGAKTKSYRILNTSPLPSRISQKMKSRFAKWTKYPIIVTKRKEAERCSSSIFAHYDPSDSVLDFDRFVNGESVEDEDLVAWITVGSHHIPGSEDIPTIQTTWNTHSFFLTPHNYFSESPNSNSDDTIIIRPPGGPDRIDRNVAYGDTYEAKCIPNTPGGKQFDGMRHDYV